MAHVRHYIEPEVARLAAPNASDEDKKRDFPYDNEFPGNFGDPGTGRYSGYAPNGSRWPHPIGEIWCATLLEMNRNIGTLLGVQLVVDALKLTPANPSFLDSRDAILDALDNMLSSEKMGVGVALGIFQAAENQPFAKVLPLHPLGKHGSSPYPLTLSQCCNDEVKVINLSVNMLRSPFFGIAIANRYRNRKRSTIKTIRTRYQYRWKSRVEHPLS